MNGSLLGEFECKVDDKGRLKIPAQLIEQLVGFESDRLVVHRGYDMHLTMYPEVVWDEKREKLSRLNPDKKDDRLAIRYFHRGASFLKIDASGRVLLPKKLKDWAGITRQVVLFAYGGEVEIWDSERYEEDVLNEPSSYGEITELLRSGSELKE